VIAEGARTNFDRCGSEFNEANVKLAGRFEVIGEVKVESYAAFMIY
jgi:hypothetical protein